MVSHASCKTFFINRPEAIGERMFVARRCSSTALETGINLGGSLAWLGPNCGVCKTGSE
jgi:hypothetical protein